MILLADHLYDKRIKGCFAHQVSVERGMSWEDATHIWAEQSGPDDGFYVQVRAIVSRFVTVIFIHSLTRCFLMLKHGLVRWIVLP